MVVGFRLIGLESAGVAITACQSFNEIAVWVCEFDAFYKSRPIAVFIFQYFDQLISLRGAGGDPFPVTDFLGSYDMT